MFSYTETRPGTGRLYAEMMEAYIVTHIPEEAMLMDYPMK